MSFNQKVLREIREKRLRNFIIEVVSLYGGSGCCHTIEQYADDIVAKTKGELFEINKVMACFENLKKDWNVVGRMFNK